MLKINEIFYSIQGETTYVGNPTVFVRLTACNLRCTYCDTKYSYYEGENQSLEEIFKIIDGHKAPYVCLTGGEPLLQKRSSHINALTCAIAAIKFLWKQAAQKC